MGKENSENIFLAKQKIEKSATMSGKRTFSVFWGRETFLLFNCMLFIFLFSAAPSKNRSFGKVYFSSFRIIGKYYFFESTHFRWRAIEKCHFLKSDHFHGFAFSDCGENISNLRKNTFAKYFRGILFWKFFCTGNIFCETVSHFLSLVRFYFPTFTHYSPTHSRIQCTLLRNP